MTASVTEAAGYIPPRLPAEMEFPQDGSEADASKASEALKAADRALTAESAAVSSDTRLTLEGQRDALTAPVQAHLTTLREHDARLAERAKELEEEVKQATVAPELSLSTAKRAELHLIADAFARKPRTEQDRLLNEVVGKREPELALALVVVNPIVHGVSAPVVAFIREGLVDAQVDQGAKDRLLGRAQRLATVRSALAAVMAAAENAADRSKLRTAGLTTLRRSDLSEPEKVEYIGRHGLTAYKSLPT